ncbi:MAG: hypothetical protein LC708_04555, partial [Actinobacteria bacterium]|nr:hypothetical protein [Actinomycetota bacterium]
PSTDDGRQSDARRLSRRLRLSTRWHGDEEPSPPRLRLRFDPARYAGLTQPAPGSLIAAIGLRQGASDVRAEVLGLVPA